MSEQDFSEKTFENEGFVVTAKKEKGCLLSVVIDIRPPLVQKVYKQAVKKVNKGISVPGFRKGKAPEETVIKNFGSHVEREWKESLLHEALKGAFALTQIYPLTKDSIERPKLETCDLEKGSRVSTSYEFYPTVPDISFDSIKLTPPKKISIKKDRIEEVLSEIQRSHASFEDITGRKVQEGDYVDVSIDAIDQEPVKSIVKDRRFEVGEKGMSPWLKKLLVGLEVDGTVEGISEVDPNAEEKIKKQFRPTKVRITLHGIKKILLPPLDDELAKKVGVADLEKLKEGIKENLTKEAESEAKEKQVHELQTLLLKQIQFDMPASIVKAEREGRFEQKLHALKQQNFSEEQLQKEQKNLEKQIEKEVDEALRLYFIERKIESQGEITLTQKELNEEIVKHMTQNAMYYGDKLDKENSQKIVSRIKEQLLKRKTQEYALSMVGKNA